MKKGVIIVDLDETLFKTECLEVSYLNKKYGIDLSPYIGNYYPSQTIKDLVNKLARLNLTEQEFYVDLIRHFMCSIEKNKKAEMCPHAKEVIDALWREYHLFISTSRISSSIHVVKYLLNKYGMEKYFNGVHFEHHINEKGELLRHTKVSLINSFKTGEVYFIDDSPFQVEKSCSIVPSILFEPDGIKIENCWQAENWLEVADLIL